MRSASGYRSLSRVLATGAGPPHTSPVAMTIERTEPVPTAVRRRGWPRVLVALLLAAALAMASALVARDLRRPGLEWTGDSLPGVGTVLRPPYGYAPSFVVNLHRDQVATYTVSIRNTTGHDIRIDHVDDPLARGAADPEAQLAAAAAYSGIPEDGYRAAAGAVVPAGGDVALRLRIAGAGCHSTATAATESTDSVRLHYRRFGLDRTVTLPLADRLVLVIGSRSPDVEDGPCGARGF